jgi:hypothetical protein
MVTQAPEDPDEPPVCAFCRTRARLVDHPVELHLVEREP